MRGFLLGLLVACKGDPAPPTTQPAPRPIDSAPVECSDLPFAMTTTVPEASGAAWLAVDGKPALFVISDSGNGGKYAIVAEDGATIEEGVLPLTDKFDDLEGVAARGDSFFTLTSPGWVHAWKRADKAFTLADGPYALGPVDLGDKRGGTSDPPPKGSGMVCTANATNCGRNYEGICLAPDAKNARCVGYAAAKADGHIYCLVEEAGKLRVQYEHAIRIAKPGAIADCAFDGDKLYVGSNIFDSGNVYRVDNWQNPDDATVALVAPLPIGNAETLAVKGDVFYRMSDTGVAPSLMRKSRCPTRP